MGRYRNPVLPGCHPDPSVCRFGDRYLLVTSTFAYLPGLPIHASRDLVTWEAVGHVIHREGQLDLAGLDSSSGLYAPTIRVIDGRLVVVCTVVGPDDGSWPGRTGHVLSTADAPEGPWSDPVWIDGVGGFDPSLTVDGDRVWLCGTRVVADAQWPGQTEVWLAEIDLATGALRTEPVAVWSGADRRAVWAEGPHIYPRPGGGWMLLAAEGGTDTDHAVVVAYADEITGPYVGDTGNPRLTHRDLGEGADIQAVGHADLVDAPDGRTWATLLATHPVGGRRGLLGRRTSLVPVEWERGRPLFAPGTGRVSAEQSADGIPDSPEPGEPGVDDFDAPVLGLAWNGVGRLPGAFADLTARPGQLRITAGESAERGFVGRRLPSERCRVAMVVQLVDGAAPLRAGLLLRVSETAFLEVAVDRGGAVTLSRVDADGVERRDLGVVEPEEPVAIGLDIVDLEAVVRVAGCEAVRLDVGGLAPSPPRGFVGAWVGPFAAGAGHADVDRVVVTLSGGRR